ncbi:MAG: hypothetical protein PVJ19_11760 [Desulfobacteraceae bacterium]|jgi:hypothetical protein
MKKIYNAKIEKRAAGSAIEHIVPEFAGSIVTHVAESSSEGAQRIFVVDCTAAEHKKNLKLKGVEALEKEKAIALAEKYQPEVKFTQINPETGKEEEITAPKCNLEPFLE